MRKINKILFAFILLFLCTCLDASTIKVNTPFPGIKLSINNLTNADLNYLGVRKNFSVKDLNSEYIFIEFLNIYCFACQKQAPIYNKLFNEINNSPELRKKVKFIGIALGNYKSEVDSFKKTHNIKFPIFTDPEFKVYTLIGGTRTPFTVILKDKKVIYTHLGLNRDYMSIFENFKNDSFIAKSEGSEKFSHLMSNEKIVLTKIKNSVKDFSSIEKFKNYYKIITKGNKVLYAVHILAKSVCNICHPMDFIYIVNSQGIITDFIPIYLTKRRNVKWNKDEISKMKKRLIGESIFKNLQFNKHVDAVTSATITSSMIFYYIKQVKNFLPIK